MATAELPKLIRTFATRADWLEARRRHIGASESASIFGVGYEDELTVWGRKVGKIIDENADREELDALEIGNILQSAIAEIARRCLGVPITEEPANTIRIHPDYPWMAASLDAHTLDDTTLIVPVELKNVGFYLSREWFGDEPPLKFQVQCQHQMAVTGAESAILFGLIGGNKPAWHVIPRNDAFIAAMIQRLSVFWQHVVSETEPPPSSSQPIKVAKALAKLHPFDNGEVVDLPEGLCAIVDEIEGIKADIKEAEELKAAAENKLKGLLGDATFGALTDGRWVSWKTQHRDEYTCKATDFRVLRIAAKRPKEVPTAAKPRKSIEYGGITIQPTKRKSYSRQRRAMLAIDPHCRWCGCTLTIETATVDHVVALAVGGSNADENLCLACEECNHERADTSCNLLK